MQTDRLNVTRRPEKFISDDRRVITRFFLPGGEDRIRSVLDRVLGLSDAEVSKVLSEVLQSFAGRHKDIGGVFLDHYGKVAHLLDKSRDALGRKRQMLIGAYFTMEYSIESAALFNPSIVPHPDQSGLAAGDTRFIMSLRATGEGHVSSIVFRTGVIDASGEIRFDPVGRFVEIAKHVKDRLYDKSTYFLKLIEMGGYDDLAQTVIDKLPEQFTFQELDCKIEETAREQSQPSSFHETAEHMRWLAQSNYHLKFPDDATPSEVVIFPTSENESRGIEDVRFVRFVDDDGSVTYYGTYTAYNGFRILPQLLETPAFSRFRITTLNGRYCQNKGMALFPHKVDGWYLMVSRIDGENLYIMPSKNIRFWNDATRLQTPAYPWEFVQLGNCGSPIETDQGWILLTHAVGPLRRYCMGASLLDLEDPKKVIGHLKEPLLMPAEDEREGYVPNVVYSCGSLIHGDQLVIPYAMADSATSFATVAVKDLLDHMKR
ncbi:MAG: glycoside hydrolase family 130 protein [Phycisphaerae bacterium]|nr:glycoside hydrolase family 130 protein [Phycisphaerae bacterium]